MRAPRNAVALPIVAFVLGCHIEEPFARTNHWDPGGDAKKFLTGTDSTFSIGDTITVTLTGDPPLPPGLLAIRWRSNEGDDTARVVFPAGYGKFVVQRANPDFHAVAVAADFDGAIVAWHVVVGQRLAAFDLFCGTVTAQVPCDATPLLPFTDRTVNSSMFDANGWPIRRREFMMQKATVVVRDPAVVNTLQTTNNPAGAWTVRGGASGATWVVITADGVRDSVRFVVP